MGVIGTNNAKGKDQDGLLSDTQRKIISNFKQELKQQDYDDAQQEVELSIGEITKASILELKSSAKPN